MTLSARWGIAGMVLPDRLRDDGALADRGATRRTVQLVAQGRLPQSSEPIGQIFVVIDAMAFKVTQAGEILPSSA